MLRLLCRVSQTLGLGILLCRALTRSVSHLQGLVAMEAAVRGASRGGAIPLHLRPRPMSCFISRLNLRSSAQAVRDCSTSHLHSQGKALLRGLAMLLKLCDPLHREHAQVRSPVALP